MPDDVGGPPFPDGDGPDSQNSGAAEEAFAAVVLDEDFVASAAIHEPSAAERMRLAGVEPSDAEPSEAMDEGISFYRDPDLDPGGLDGLPVRGSTDVEGFGPLDDPDLLDELDDLDGLDDLDALDDLHELHALDVLDALDEANGLERLTPSDPLDELDDPDDPDDEGRFDRSDYTRYLPGEAESSPGLLALPPPPGEPPSERGAARGQDARRPRPPRGPGRRPLTWQRSVACLLAMMMSLSVIALTLIAIQRAGGSRDPSPAPTVPASTPDGLAGDPGDSGDVPGQTVADAEFADTDVLGEGP
ncbi:hypothetical protein [Streptomyces profundus]|uniref:SCO2584 family spore wall biosynthesis protein n=1 Tax=Streptomyces profundus TaxID=2867410 RepID=UPI002ADDA1B0|nr:hypothetical protein [Streptomyces sp. MA3_2.13]UED86485.1 hypothetical protein K4G22_21715 [Streptomyces sp. MA3_2.13]